MSGRQEQQPRGSGVDVNNNTEGGLSNLGLAADDTLSRKGGNKGRRHREAVGGGAFIRCWEGLGVYRENVGCFIEGHQSGAAFMKRGKYVAYGFLLPRFDASIWSSNT